MPCTNAGRSSACRLLALVVFLVSYLAFGALVFIGLEGPQEKVLNEQIQIARAVFKNAVNSCVTDDELESFIVEIVRANNRGVSAVRNVTSEPNWSFGQAFFFAGTVLTTIGYGHVTPLSEGGKVFCIVYAIIGIPLTLIMFTALVERIMVPTTLILEYMQKKMGHLYQTLHIKLLHLTGIVLTLLVLVFLIPATIFSHLEPGWNYLDAFYYSFISMTTIGLGDYIPGDSPDQANRTVYKIITTFYLFVGLILMMVMLAHLHRVPELNVGFHFYMMSDEGTNEERSRIRPSGKVGTYTQQHDEVETNESYQGIPEDDQTQLTK